MPELPWVTFPVSSREIVGHDVLTTLTASHPYIEPGTGWQKWETNHTPKGDIPTHKYGVGCHQNYSTKNNVVLSHKINVTGGLHEKKNAGENWGPWPTIARPMAKLWLSHVIAVAWQAMPRLWPGFGRAMAGPVSGSKRQAIIQGNHSVPVTLRQAMLAGHGRPGAVNELDGVP